jgi:filamentous hemagglutinin
LTGHARESLRRHGFREPFQDVDDVIDNFMRQTTQADGATVYIQRSKGRGRRYHIVIVGDEGIVTGLRDLSRHELENLGRNHGFDPAP